MEVVSSTQFKAHFEAHDIMNTKRMRGREGGREGRHFSIFRESIWQHSTHEEAVLGTIHSLQLLKVFPGIANVDQRGCRRDRRIRHHHHHVRV